MPPTSGISFTLYGKAKLGTTVKLSSLSNATNNKQEQCTQLKYPPNSVKPCKFPCVTELSLDLCVHDGGTAGLQAHQPRKKERKKKKASTVYRLVQTSLAWPVANEAGNSWTYTPGKGGEWGDRRWV